MIPYIEDFYTQQEADELFEFIKAQPFVRPFACATRTTRSGPENLVSTVKAAPDDEPDFKQRRATTMNWCALVIWNHGGWEYCDAPGTVKDRGKWWCEKHYDGLVKAGEIFPRLERLSGEEAEHFEEFLREEIFQQEERYE